MFQSTHSLRSATTLQSLLFCRINVSIHALLAECDTFRRAVQTYIAKFQSTHSLRSATGPLTSVPRIPIVSIHALLAECDLH
nr:MAG TPA: hypothetical protein [Caudoviricetes sp.]